jgi:hypothetical protein
MRFAQRREGRNPLHFERVDYSVVMKNRAPLRNRGDGFIELGLYQLYQLKECFLARALRGYDIWKSMNYNDIRMPLDPDMRTRNFIQIIKRDVNYPRYGNKKRRSLHPGGKIVCHHLGSPLYNPVPVAHTNVMIMTGKFLPYPPVEHAHNCPPRSNE